MTDLLSTYKKMVLIRTTEEQLAEYYRRNKIFSFVHFCVGQEAVAIGVCDALRASDKVLGNHRSHGHYLAKGGDLKRMICELLGKENGCCRGRGGSMHLIDKSVNYIGSTPILGSVVPIAAGVAFEQKRGGKSDDITVVFFGDGAFEEGVVYETINLATYLKLPILFVIENNLLATNSRLNDRRSPQHNVRQIVLGLGAGYCKANGNDYQQVRGRALDAIDYWVRRGAPMVLECMTYRHMAHSGPIFEEQYREQDTAEKRKQEDPIKRIRQQVLENLKCSDGYIAEIDNSIAATVSEAIEFAESSAYPFSELAQ